MTDSVTYVKSAIAKKSLIVTSLIERDDSSHKVVMLIALIVKMCSMSDERDDLSLICHCVTPLVFTSVIRFLLQRCSTNKKVMIKKTYQYSQFNLDK